MMKVIHYGMDAERFANKLPIKNIFEYYEKPTCVSLLDTTGFAGRISIHMSGVNQTSIKDGREESMIRIFAADKVSVGESKDHGLTRRICVSLNDGKVNPSTNNIIFIVPSNEQTCKSQQVCDMVCECVYNLIIRPFYADVYIAVVFDGLPFFNLFVPDRQNCKDDMRKIMLQYLSMLI